MGTADRAGAQLTEGIMDIQGPIAVVAAGELFGGVERHVLGLGAFLRERGLQPQIVLFHERELAACCRADGLPVSILPVSGSYDPAGPRRLDDLLTAAGTRLVHVHGYRAAVNAALCPTVRPMVCTVHGQGEPSWRTPSAFLKDDLYRRGEAWACRRRRAVVCFVTDDLRRRHAHRYRGLEVRTVHNGIEPLDRTTLLPSDPPLAPSRLHAVAAGRLTRVKGLGFAIEALAQLLASHPWQLDLVGEGVLREELAALATRLGVADRVTFHGFRRDVAAMMAGADALIMPSLHEGLPYALLEAMSLGLPVVASNVGGLAEVLRHEETGLLVPAGDARALAAALARLADAAELRVALGAAAAREQRRVYSLAAMGGGYLAAYRHVLPA
jgi:glycosyltransferase involved in cell wall biosynthesis